MNRKSDWRTFDEKSWDLLRVSHESLFRRMSDFLFRCEGRSLRRLHGRVRHQLANARKYWKGYDYGLGYLYQNFPPLGLSGRRDTEARVVALSLAERCRGRAVLDIGCNTGFISLAVAPVASRVTGFDVNPYLVEIANDCAHHLGMDNVGFLRSSFADYSPDTRYDVILSLSNHITADRPICPTLENYFDKCASLLKPKGTFIFESHSRAFEAVEGGGIEKLPLWLDARFETLLKTQSDRGTALDLDRLLYIGQRP